MAVLNGAKFFKSLAWLPPHRFRAKSALVYSLTATFVVFGMLQIQSWRHSSSQRIAYIVEALNSSDSLDEADFYSIIGSLPRPSNSSGRCFAPSLPLFNDFIRQHRPARIPADVCRQSQPNWLRVSQSRLYLRAGYAAANCTAEPVLRVDDLTSSFGSPQPIRSGDELPSLGFRAACRLPDGRRHSSVYYGVRRVRPPAPKDVDDSARDNIVMIGLDSLSRLESLRSLVNASRLLRDQLDGISLQQYNIMGDGTPAALGPILTGLREEEMPEGRRGIKGAQHFDDMPAMRFIFQKLRDLGYVTLYGEEGNNVGTFQMRFLGFKKEPADVYLRPVMLKQEAVQTRAICIGDEVSAGRMLNSVKDLFSLHPDRPKFSFTFFSQLSHESQDLTPMDSEISKFLDWFIAEKLIGNTSLILMSDHGQRLGPLRNSMQGKLEESLPLMTFALSRQLTERLKGARQTLASNQDRLTAPTDIHQTLLSIAGAARGQGASGKFRSYSLIDEAVPETRSCSEAGIPNHWCSCLSAKTLEEPESQQLAVRAALFAVKQINQATQGLRKICAELSLQGVSQAEVSLASLDLSKRERRIGSVYAYNVEIKSLVSSGYVTVRFATNPNAGLYEATAQFALHNNKAAGEPKQPDYQLGFSLIGEVSRINRYGSAADCVAHRLPSLRKFCFCKDVL